MKPLFRVSVSIAVLLGLASCQGFNPALDTFLIVMNKKGNSTDYKPEFSYMQVEVEGRQTVMALGYRSHDGHRLHEHWYSSQREMLYLVDGRIHQAMGLTHEIRAQHPLAPLWRDLLQATEPATWSRTLDVQPGYRYGLVEHVVTQKVAPSKAEAAALPQATTWFEERVVSESMERRSWTYTQKFALVQQQVVYSEQCLAPELCFKLKPVDVGAP